MMKDPANRNTSWEQPGDRFMCFLVFCIFVGARHSLHQPPYGMLERHRWRILSTTMFARTICIAAALAAHGLRRPARADSPFCTYTRRIRKLRHRDPAFVGESITESGFGWRGSVTMAVCQDPDRVRRQAASGDNLMPHSCGHLGAIRANERMSKWYRARGTLLGATDQIIYMAPVGLGSR